jgi:hypothetical protein
MLRDGSFRVARSPDQPRADGEGGQARGVGGEQAPLRLGPGLAVEEALTSGWGCRLVDAEQVMSVEEDPRQGANLVGLFNRSMRCPPMKPEPPLMKIRIRRRHRHPGAAREETPAW